MKILQDRGILPGIKVDKGVVPLAGTDDECTTQGKVLVFSILKSFFLIRKIDFQNIGMLGLRFELLLILLLWNCAVRLWRNVDTCI